MNYLSGRFVYTVETRGLQMDIYKKPLLFLLFMAISLSGQGFKQGGNKVQTFSLLDETGRNQASFFSSTPFEDIEGTTNGISGNVSLNMSDFKTLSGIIEVSLQSIRTGIGLRDNHLKSHNWLNADEFPTIVFEIDSVSEIKQINDNKLSAVINGFFTLHGVVKPISAEVDVQFIKESEASTKRMPGDLLGVTGKFSFNLSHFEISNKLIGEKVAEEISIKLNIVGSNRIN